MSVKFKPTQRVDPRDLTLPRKYYPQIIYGDDVSFDELADVISKMSNLNYGSVVGMLATLTEAIQLQLAHGRQVKLSGLGTFYLTLTGDGQARPEDLSSGDIKQSHLRFRPDKRLKGTLQRLDYTKVSTTHSGQ